MSPQGFTKDYNREIWNVGHLFTYSFVFNCYVQHNERITVKPGETPSEAYERENNGSPLFTKEVFFVDEG